MELMKLLLRVGLAAALQACLLPSASAQWQGSIGLTARGVVHAEYDTAGQRLVRETGWLPGIALAAAYQTDNVTVFGGADWYRDDIAYRGQTQAGVATNSRTATALGAVRLGAAYAWGGGYSLRAALELDRWKRDIAGTGRSVGLQETYRSVRLVAGVGKSWQSRFGALGADAAVVLSTPERMHVAFSGVIDPVSLDTKRGHGIRLGASLRPALAPRLELRGSVDWIKVPRSDAVALNADNPFLGTVAQPEHTRQALSLTVAALF